MEPQTTKIRYFATAPFFICVEGISQAEMLAFLFGAARESEKLAESVSRD